MHLSRIVLALAAGILLGWAVPSFVPLGSPAFAQEKLTDLSVGDYVEITTRAGARFGGEVVQIEERQIRIKTRFGVQTINLDDVTKWERRKSTEDVYKERAAKCSTADDWCDLGEWAQGENQHPLAEKAFAKAIELDPDHERAREQRGEVKHDGKWMPLEDAMKAAGKELFRGKWVTPDEKAKLLEAEEKAMEDEKLKGLGEIQAEYIGRSWGEIEPVVTEHYEVWCNSTESMALYYADLMEELYSKYAKIFPKRFFPRRNFKGKRSKVFIHRCHQQFMDWTGVGPNIGGFYRPWLHDVTAYHGSFGVTGRTEEVLAHEGTHQFQGVIFKGLSNCPMWIIEGMACYFGDGTEIKRGRVKINVIPRDRLVGLKRAIRNGTYTPLKQLLRLGRGRFTGFHYGHGWGVIYWCLYGKEMGAKHCNNGRKIMEDYLLHAKDNDKFLDGAGYEREAVYFENLLTENTGLSVDEWEEQYKEWILELPLPELGKRKSGRWVSTTLLIDVAKPGGWRFVDDEELNTNAQEVVAFEKGGRGVQRISTHCFPNWAKADLSPEVARKFIEGNFVNITWEQEPVLTKVKGYPAVETQFRGARRARQESSATGEGDDAKKAEPKDTVHVYKAVLYGDTDKLRANVLETDAEYLEKNLAVFDSYLDKFRITY